MGKNKGSKKVKKFFKELVEEVKSLELTKHHFYYTILCLIILILSIFLFNNYNKCKLYEITVDSGNIIVKNGLLVVSDGNNIVRIDNISYTGEIENATSVKMSLIVKVDDEEVLLNSFSSLSGEGFNLSEYLDRISFDINETKHNEDVITSRVKKYIEKNLYLKVEITNLEGNEEEYNIRLNVDRLYSNNKLFY